MAPSDIISLISLGFLILCSAIGAVITTVKYLQSRFDRSEDQINGFREQVLEEVEELRGQVQDHGQRLAVMEARCQAKGEGC